MVTAPVLIQYAIHKFQAFFWRGEFNLETISAVAWYWKIIIPTLGGTVVGLVIRYVAKEAKGHGVPEVMEAIALRNGIIRSTCCVGKTLFISFIYCFRRISWTRRAGHSDRLGQSVQQLDNFLKSTLNGCASLLPVVLPQELLRAFNAPIAGALFAVEIILGDFAVSQVTPIVLASVVATSCLTTFSGRLPSI